MVSQSRIVLIHQVIPLIDALHDVLLGAMNDTSAHTAVRYAANSALIILNKYYRKTDECDIYRIAMGDVANSVEIHMVLN